ncbi:SRPBCC domain-containing protein [Rathayibacter soli]|uniref:SRPBCC domain-containing protein n=1 Tax=Rathayibacter soli TaxID=3144168 RepID=UPI0027E53A4D|nr:SRPBCC domain-containing protein [Glaciibacter superstes]
MASPNGNATLLTGGVRPAVRFERHLTDTAPAVWQSLTDRSRLKTWFPSDVIVAGGQWQVGAAISFPFPPDQIDMTLTGEVIIVDEPYVLAYTWGDELLRFELSPMSDGTELVLIDELEASVAARNAAGWEGCLDLLEGRPSAPDDWQGYFDAYAAAFEPVLGPQAGPPAEYHGT